LVDQTPRAALEAALKPLLPANWKIVPNSSALDASNVPVVQLFQQRIHRMEQAPEGFHLIDFTVQITSPFGADRARAEDDTNDSVNALIHAIDKAGILWTEATPFVSPDEQSFGYKVELSITSTKEA
jgi:hypothetical protein